MNAGADLMALNTAKRTQLHESPFFPETRNSLLHHEAKHLMQLKHTVLSLLRGMLGLGPL